jgi:uncharacterized integral membrane protein
MIKLVYVLVIVITLFLGLTFTYMNNQTVELNYLSYQAEVNLPILLLCTLVTGAFSGYLVSLLSSLKIRRKLSRAKKDIRNLESVNVKL